jgi:hypothetical protein
MTIYLQYTIGLWMCQSDREARAGRVPTPQDGIGNGVRRGLDRAAGQHAREQIFAHKHVDEHRRSRAGQVG